MKLKYSPVKWSEVVTWAPRDTVIEIVDENTITVDGEPYEFGIDSVSWDDLRVRTGGVIQEAHRDDDGTLYVTVRRYYSDQRRPDWDTGDYHEVVV